MGYTIKNSIKGFPINATPLPILKQFQDFCIKNNPATLEEAIECFTVFGGFNGKIDTTRPLFELIRTHILEHYRSIHAQVANITENDAIFHALLTGAATGDRRMYSAFKRARVNEREGKECIALLCEKELLSIEKSRAMPSERGDDLHLVSDKLHFNTPFMRFWFAFVSPLFKGIQKGDFKEVETAFANRQQEFTTYIFERLSQEYLKQMFVEDPLIECDSYWDGEVELSILAETKSGKSVVAECKYTNTKLKKSELSKIDEKCHSAGITADSVVLFAKKGFSSELRGLKNEHLQLIAVKNFKKLLEPSA